MNGDPGPPPPGTEPLLGDYNPAMLRACMIDGFGWFTEASYRRSWLFFDEVDYLFPSDSAWPGYPPPWAASSRDFALARPELSPAEMESLVDGARACCDSHFSTFVNDNVPERDARYAVDAVSFDNDVRRGGEDLLNVFGPDYIRGKPVHLFASDIAITHMGQLQVGIGALHENLGDRTA